KQGLKSQVETQIEQGNLAGAKKKLACGYTTACSLGMGLGSSKKMALILPFFAQELSWNAQKMREFQLSEEAQQCLYFLYALQIQEGYPSTGMYLDELKKTLQEAAKEEDPYLFNDEINFENINQKNP